MRQGEGHLLATASCSVWHRYLGLAPRQRLGEPSTWPAAAPSAASSTAVTVSYTRGRPTFLPAAVCANTRGGTLSNG